MNRIGLYEQTLRDAAWLKGDHWMAVWGRRQYRIAIGIEKAKERRRANQERYSRRKQP